MSHIYLSTDKHYYSVPHRYIGKRTQVHYTERLVEIYFKHQRIATHFRSRLVSGYTTKKEHLPEQHQFYLKWNPQFFIEKAANIGAYTSQYIQRLFKQQGHAETKCKTAMGIVQLTKHYEKIRLENACKVGMLHPVSSYQIILGILEKKLDMQADLFTQVDKDQSSHIPEHENIRGSNHYSQLVKNVNNHESNN